MSTNSTLKVGRRKTATARVLMKPGNGTIIINKKEAKDYFKTQNLFEEVMHPLKATDTVGKYDLSVVVSGGGFTGQAGAIKLAISRALVENDAEMKSTLRQERSFNFPRDRIFLNIFYKKAYSLISFYLCLYYFIRDVKWKMIGVEEKTKVNSLKLVI